MQQKTAARPGTSFGAYPADGGTEFAVWSGSAEQVWLCLFDGAAETDRIDMKPDGLGRWSAHVAGAGPGTRYGFRADGPYDRDAGLWFDPSKLLVDPYAVAVDQPYVYDARLALPRDAGFDTAALIPKAVVVDLPDAVPILPPLYEPGGLIYEVQVKALTKLHPGVPEALRGTIAGLAHPAVIEHLVKLGVGAVELMPVTADRRTAPRPARTDERLGL